MEERDSSRVSVCWIFECRCCILIPQRQSDILLYLILAQLSEKYINIQYQYLASSILHPVSCIQFLCIQFFVSSILYPASCIQYLASSIRASGENPKNSTKHHCSKSFSISFLGFLF